MSVFRDKRILVTGSTDGIGLLTARQLSAEGARVLVHGRNPDRVRAAVQQVPGAEALVADLSSLREVRRMAEAVGKGPPLDVLINNAGVGFGPRGGRRETSADGYELRWAVNFLAPFALTEWLLEQPAAPRAIVNVASLGQAPIDFTDVGLERHYDEVQAYRRSKLALIMWTFELATRRPTLPVNALHPGTYLATKMVTESGITPLGTVESGARAVVSLAGLTLGGKVRGAFFDVQREARALEQAYDPDARQRLRQLASAMVERAPTLSG